MKKISIVAALLALGGTVAHAADLGVYIPEAVAYGADSAFDWSGLYAGVNLGYGWAALESGGVTYDDGKGILGGVQVGYNQDFGGFVLGAEADFQLSDVSYEEVIGGVTARTAIDNFGTVRARAGLAVDRFMPYVTGGLAWANASASVSAGVGRAEVKDNYIGWTVGAGLEYALADNVSLKAEYLYIDYGTAQFGTGVDMKLTSNVVRAGLNYKF